MAGILFGSIEACRRTTHCLGILRSSCRPLVAYSSIKPLHHRRRRYTSSSKSGESAEKKGSGRLNQEVSQAKKPDKSTVGLEMAAAPPDPPKVPEEQRPELPYEVRPEILPLQDQPNRSQPAPTEVKPPNPQTIVCRSDNRGSSGSSNNFLGSNDKMVGKVVEFAPSVRTTEKKDFGQSISIHSTKSKDEPKDNLFLIESELKTLAASVSDFIDNPIQKDFSLIKAELKSTDSTSKESKAEISLPGLSKSITDTPLKTSPNTHESKNLITANDSSKPQISNTTSLNPNPDNSKPNSSSKTNPHENLNLKVISSTLQKTTTKNIKDLEESSTIKTRETTSSQESESSSFNMPREGKISGIKVNSKTLVDRSMEFSKMLDKAHEKRFYNVDTHNENQENRDRIHKWVEHFKSVSKKAACASETKSTAKSPTPIEYKIEKPYFIETLVKKENCWVPKDKTLSNNISHSDGQNSTSTNTSKIVSQLELPLKIVAKHEAPTEFRQKFKPIPSSELQSNKNNMLDSKTEATKHTEFIFNQPLSNKSLQSPPVDSVKQNAFIAVDNGKIVRIGHNETKRNQSTEEIVALFKDDYDGEPNKNEEGKVNELFETLEKFNNNPGSWWTLPELSAATKSSQTEVLAMLSLTSDKKGGQIGINKKGRLNTTDSGNKSEDHFTKLGDLDSTIREEEEEKDQGKKDNPNEDYFVKLSNLDSTIREDKSVKLNKNVEHAESEKNAEKHVELKSFDLAQKVSSFMKSAEKGVIKDNATQKSRRLEKGESRSSSSKVTTTSELTPSDLYDPVSPEISSPSPLETGKTELKEDAEESTPSLEAPEVKPKKEETKVKAPTSMDETTTKADQKPPVEVNLPKKEKPQLDDGELALKLRDKATGEQPVLQTAVPLKPQVEKSFIQHLFDKILGRGKNDEGKRRMSSFTGQRHMSTFSMNTLPYGIAPGPQNRDRVLVNRKLDLFAKNDDTEIKGGSPECSSPKKSPRELLREKQQTRKIKILGGSKECAKKMKRLKELEKDIDDDDCGRRCFSNSLSPFLRQLWMRQTPRTKLNNLLIYPTTRDQRC
ncbi:uncharacterized protein Dyak_GE24889, isoform B [Drosophila yakuba]|uniref:Uncharacterized protein, isoform B n=1 Tax=Drosophila yakuba TaxID=7245 RepID=A0A0R1E1I2_DROYA|nr:uncharacterized protein Dyak_GE24889, isoform B [Drosophila yakuba]